MSKLFYDYHNYISVLFLRYFDPFIIMAKDYNVAITDIPSKQRDINFMNLSQQYILFFEIKMIRFFVRC